METLPFTQCAAVRLLRAYYLHIFFFPKFRGDRFMCTRIYQWHCLSPLVPSVLSMVGAEMGPTFWKLQKCAAFRLLHRYQLHFALVVAFSFCFENGAPAEKWKMGACGERRRYQQHLEWSLSMVDPWRVAWRTLRRTHPQRHEPPRACTPRSAPLRGGDDRDHLRQDTSP